MALFIAPSISVSPRGSMAAGCDAARPVVRLCGDHDLATKLAVAHAIAGAWQRDDTDVVVDLSEVTFMDASTVGAVIGCSRLLHERARALQLRAPSPPAARVLALCGLDHLVAPDAALPARLGAVLSTWVEVPSVQPN